ncbi:O-antigen ligase family protein [Pseudomonas ogarae]|nr:O-antigen ligase family protein [Pseudomonas ogarae]
MRIMFERPVLDERRYITSSVFAVLVLFAPTSSFHIFYAALAFGLLLLVFGGGGRLPWRTQIFYIYIGCVCFFLMLSLFRVLYFSNAEDFKELLKLFIFGTVIFFGVRLKGRELEFWFSLFVVVNLLVSLLQYLGVYSFGIREFTDFYNAKHHVDHSLSYSSPRALGLSAGPGQQSVLSLFFFSFFLVVYFFGGGGNRRIILCLLALFTAVLSQSKTALIAVAIGSVAVTLLFVAHAGYKGKLVMVLFFVIVLGGAMVFKDQILILFPEYVRLSEQGGDVSSLQSRFGNWLQMVDAFFAENSFVFYLFGVGRSGLEYYGVNELPYDSDYIYILVNYGILGIVLFFGGVGAFLVRGIIFFSSENLYGKILVVALIYALISAVALNFFFEPRVFILFAIIVFKYLTARKNAPI